jgi:hypothetical protein
MTTTTTTKQALEQAVQAMHQGDNLFDVTIVCTTDDHQAAYWMAQLSQGVCARPTTASSDADSSPYPMVLAVAEDWVGSSGAGNGLGTLYAYEKAVALARAKHDVDLAAALAAGDISVALYHTAGKGTRMAPLPASENNNKPGVTLPFGLLQGESYQSVTVLESVVRQTGIYARSRQGRLSVFWGDQVFLPSAAFLYQPSHHVDILCTLLGETAPTAEEWTAQGLDKYGVIACLETADGKMEAAQVEKVSHAVATQMLGALGGTLQQVGPSLGSFSVSAAMLQALCTEFRTELVEKTAKFDTDPHFWMPLTLSETDYATLMKGKGVEENVSIQHHQRMTAMKASFALGSLGLFGAVDVGKDACWWDYGLLKLYSKNSLLLLEDSLSADLLRQFLGLTVHVVKSSLEDGVTVDETSYAYNTQVKAGSIHKSILAGVRALELQADGAILVNCVAKKIVAGPGAILYNILDDSDEGVTAQAGEVMVAVTDETGAATRLCSRMDIDGGKAWKIKLDMNEVSFEEMHKKNKDSNIGEIQKKRQATFDSMSAAMGF